MRPPGDAQRPLPRPVQILRGFVVLHALGAAFGLLGFLFWPEQVIDLVPESVALEDVRHVMALMAVLPATFVAWDAVLLVGIRRRRRDALFVGFIGGSAALMGAAIHATFEVWSLAAVDGIMGLIFLELTWWAWRVWPSGVGEDR